MRRNLVRAFALAFAAMTGSQASAWLLYPDNDQPERIIVEIERPVGEFVPFSALPPPFDTALQERQQPDTLSYRWRYDLTAQGMAYLQVDEEGDGVMRFHFAAAQFLPGERLGAAAVLVDANGTALHSFYARADLPTDTRTGPIEAIAALDLSRPPQWWRGVDGVTLLFMRYHPIQELDDAEVWTAMRQAVHRITKGQGAEHQALARP